MQAGKYESAQKNITDITNNRSELFDILDTLSVDTKNAKLVNEEIQQQLKNVLPSLLTRDEEIRETNKNLSALIQLLNNVPNENNNVLEILTEISNRIQQLQHINNDLNNTNIGDDKN